MRKSMRSQKLDRLPLLHKDPFDRILSWRNRKTGVGLWSVRIHR